MRAKNKKIVEEQGDIIVKDLSPHLNYVIKTTTKQSGRAPRA
jgi:hypothetical protein